MQLLFKAFLYLGIYSVLHFGYELTRLSFLKPICGTSESVFEHLKMGFFAYLFASLIECAFSVPNRRKVNFLSSRILSTFLVPWVIFSTWYLGPALWGKTSSLLLELSWALGVTFYSGIVGVLLERETERIQFTPKTRVLLFLLFGIALFLFVRFTYVLPWIDVFALP